MQFFKLIQNFWHTVVSESKKEIIEYGSPAIAYIEANGGKAVLMIAETVLGGAMTGVPWATLLAQLIGLAEQQGITLAEGAAAAVLNYAKATMIAKQAA